MCRMQRIFQIIGFVLALGVGLGANAVVSADDLGFIVPDGVDLTMPGDTGVGNTPSKDGAATAADPMARDFNLALDAFNGGDAKNARQRWRKLADAGHGESAHNLALMMLRGQGGVRDVLAALTMFEVAAEADVAAAQHALGMFYLQGYGVPKDTTKAFQYFKRAAGGGYLPSRYNLAIAALSEDSASAQARGVAMLQDAADGGLARASYDLGVLVYQGKAGPKDLPAARRFFERAAKAGDPFGAYNLALMQLAGEGGSREPALARAHLEAAALAGAVPAQVRLAYVLAEAGENESAFKWFTIAAAFNDATAAKNADRLSPRLNAAQRARALNAAQAFRAQPISTRLQDN
jgi:TPR repeat protein